MKFWVVFSVVLLVLVSAQCWLCWTVSDPGSCIDSRWDADKKVYICEMEVRP